MLTPQQQHPLSLLLQLYTQRHNRIDYIIPIILQRLNSLLPRHTSLRHHQLNILLLEPRIINFFAVVVIVVFSSSGLVVFGFLFALAVVG